MGSDSLTQTLKERGGRYGRFEDQSKIAVGIRRALKMDSHRFSTHPEYVQEALHMIANKLGRIVNGDPMYDDSWRDIAGYATLVVEILNEGKDND